MKKTALIVGIATTLLVAAGAVIVVTWGGLRALINRPDTLEAQARGRAQDAARLTSARGRMQDAAPVTSDRGAMASTERRYVNAGEQAPELETLQGTVVVGTAESNDVIIETAAGQQAPVGTGPGWLQSQGFVLRQGDEVSISGYWEDGEFKAVEIVRLHDGARITLRDAEGHPAWAGSGRRAEAQSLQSSEGQTQGRGQQKR